MNDRGQDAEKVLRPRLAYISPLLPAATGVADYSAHLLPELSRYYDITVITPQQTVEWPDAAFSLPVRNVEWFMENGGGFDRIVYHFGNSRFHTHMREMLYKHPGMVVMHDFFLGDVSYPGNESDEQTSLYLSRLYRSHGYEALAWYWMEGWLATSPKYPVNLDILERATGVIVHSHYAIDAAIQWYNLPREHFHLVPIPWQPPNSVDRLAARARLGIAGDDFLLCSFGHIFDSKCPQEIIESWLTSALVTDKRCRVIFVGGGDDNTRRVLEVKIKAAGCSDRFSFTGFAKKASYEDYLAAADLSVQLRKLSRGESSSSILDNFASGIPTIINAHATLAEFPEDVALRLPDHFTCGELTNAFNRLWQDAGLRSRLGEAGRSYARRFHNPQAVSVRYRDALEQNILTGHSCLGSKRLFIDISGFYSRRMKASGKPLLPETFWRLVVTTPVGFRVEPIRYQAGHYRYARKFMLDQLTLPSDGWEDDPVTPAAGDILLRLPAKLSISRFPQGRILRDWKKKGVEIHSVGNDFLPLFEKKDVRNFLEQLIADLKSKSSINQKNEIARNASRMRQAFPPPSTEENDDLSEKAVPRLDRIFTSLKRDVEYRLNGINSFRPFLGEGWFPNENWEGAWSNGPCAQMQFCIAANQKKGHLLKLEGLALVDQEKYPTLKVYASINGHTSGDAHFTFGTAMYSLEISLRHAMPNGYCHLRLQIQEPRSPHQLGIGADKRELGFGLIKMTICRG